MSDPFRKLEQMRSPDVKSWVEKENQLTDNYLQSSSVRNKFITEMTKLQDTLQIGLPSKQGDYYFIEVVDGLQH